MQGASFFEKIITDLKQFDFSDSQKKVELYAGLHPVKRKVIITGWPVNVNDIILEYLISYYYDVNGVEYSLNLDPSYQPKSGRYVCSHVIYQKFVFDGVKPNLINFNAEDIQSELASQQLEKENAITPTLLTAYIDNERYFYKTEYDMWRQLLTDRKIYFKAGGNKMAIDIDFDTLMASAISNLDEKGVFDLI